MLILPLTVDDSLDFYVMLFEIKANSINLGIEPQADTLVVLIVGTTRDKHSELVNLPADSTMSLNLEKDIFYVSGIKDYGTVISGLVSNIMASFPAKDTVFGAKLHNSSKTFGGRFINNEGESVCFDDMGVETVFTVQDSKIKVNLTSIDLSLPRYMTERYWPTTNNDTYNMAIDDVFAAVVTKSYMVIEKLLFHMPITFLFIGRLYSRFVRDLRGETVEAQLGLEDVETLVLGSVSIIIPGFEENYKSVSESNAGAFATKKRRSKRKAQ